MVEIKKFVKLITKEINQRLSEVSINFDKENFRLNINFEETQIQFNLDNVYNDYVKASSSERDDIINDYIAPLLEIFCDIPEDFEDIQKIIFPRVQNTIIRENLRLELRLKGGDDLDFPSQLLADGLIITLVIDHQHSLSFITSEQLEDWNVSFDDAFTVAKRNLLNETHGSFDVISPGTYSGEWKDSHTASRIVIPHVLKKLEVKGDFVVMVPARNYFLVTGSEDVDGLENIANIAQQVLDEDHRTLTGFAYRLKGDTWQKFLPPKEHPSYYMFKLLDSQSLSIDYSSQKELLEKIFEQEQKDLFVASFQIIQEKETDSLKTFSTWSDRVVTLLPRTDLIAFYKEKNDETVLCNWEDVETLAGDIIIRQKQFEPVRYFVDSFPDENAWKTLKTLEIRKE